MTVGAGAHHRRIPDRRPRCPTDPRQRDRSVLRRFHWPIRGVHSGRTGQQVWTLTMPARWARTTKRRTWSSCR